MARPPYTRAPSAYAFTPGHRGGNGRPLVCIHGFADTWRIWEMVLPALERHHDVLALTLPGHAGGPPITTAVHDRLMADAVANAMDEAGFETAHLVGNSLGGFVALQLAARGRADSVVALAPAGGWARGSASPERLLGFQAAMQEQARAAAGYADVLVASPQGRRQATAWIAENWEHIPGELIAHQLAGAARCDGAARLIAYASQAEWTLDAEHIECPVRVVWGTADKLLPWPSAAVRYRREWLPTADWVELESVGHCPQLDVPLETAELILGLTATANRASG
jgi:pimeloyl-ACP methyl ester carboxylesterase